MPHWLSEIGKDVRDALVKVVVTGIATTAWSKRDKLTALFKKFKTTSATTTTSYAVGLDQPSGRAKSIGISFGQPTPTPNGIVFSASISQTK